VLDGASLLSGLCERDAKAQVRRVGGGAQLQSCLILRDCLSCFAGGLQQSTMLIPRIGMLWIKLHRSGCTLCCLRERSHGCERSRIGQVGIRVIGFKGSGLTSMRKCARDVPSLQLEPAQVSQRFNPQRSTLGGAKPPSLGFRDFALLQSDERKTHPCSRQRKSLLEMRLSFRPTTFLKVSFAHRERLTWREWLQGFGAESLGFHQRELRFAGERREPLQQLPSKRHVPFSTKVRQPQVKVGLIDCVQQLDDARRRS
jgi:hypothetical protein